MDPGGAFKDLRKWLLVTWTLDLCAKWWFGKQKGFGIFSKKKFHNCMGLKKNQNVAFVKIMTIVAAG